MSTQRVTILGGTGFLGRYVAQSLVEAGYAVQVIARRASKCRHLMPLAAKGQLALRDGDVTKPNSIQGSLRGSFAVVNLVGIAYEKGTQRFSSLHAQMPERIAQMAVTEGVKSFIHISALAVDRATKSSYARSKFTGEKAIRNAFPDATILRPSVLFGPEDRIFNQWAALASISPILPLIGGGKTQFQPVFVGDVAKAILASLQQPQARGKTYALGGPDVMTLAEIMRYTLTHSRQKACLIPLPWILSSLLGTIGQLLPFPPLTRDQVKLLRYDNTLSPPDDQDGFSCLNICPTPVDVVAPQYLRRYSRDTHPLTADA